MERTIPVSTLAGGGGSHRLTIGSEAGPFTDPDGFAWAASGS